MGAPFKFYAKRDGQFRAAFGGVETHARPLSAGALII
jgi:hypothetical protein